MATRGVIARMTPNGFTGVYHHWDSYPSGLGATLFHLYQGHFHHHLQAMLHTLIDEHVAGWSTINDADFSQEPGFIEREHELGNDDPRHHRPQCYCHGDRHETSKGFIEMHGDDWGAEYAYAINEAACMSIYARYHSEWILRGEVDLRGAEPDWMKFE